MATGLTSNADQLLRLLTGWAPVTIAVSGGVDSMTLACFAHRLLPSGTVRMVHATSPAVPESAGTRVKHLASNEGWQLDIVDAGEFADARYRANPVNRCFFCKSNLYETLTRLSDGVVLSGTNRDDLGDYRPGLIAAQNHGVRHPYVEAGIDKAEVRALATALGLPDYAALPASPCLSSRVETGLPIEAEQLRMIDTVEDWCRKNLGATTVRCRVRKAGIVIELDDKTCDALAQDRLELAEQLRRFIPQLHQRNIAFAPYQQGSAFVGKPPREASRV